MQEISAYVSENKFSATATGELTDEYFDDSLHICVLSNLAIKASKIALLYRESNEDFLEKLPPETAFILHDIATSRTFFGTDIFAIKPVFYSLQSGNLLIHSNLNDLLIFSEKNALNHHKVIEYFKWKSDDLPADNQTFYQDIFRLLPAQTGRFQNGKLTFRSINAISPNSDLIAEYQVVRRFKEAFENAVSCRKTNGISAANLSGGLDSSSVVAVLATLTNREVSTVYFDAQKPEANERSFAHSIVTKYKTNHNEVSAPKLLFNSLRFLTEKIAQPDPGVLPSFIHEAIFDEVKRTNTKRLFSGHGGDNITGYGFEHLEALFQLESWKSLKTAGRNYDRLRQNEEPIAKSIFKRNIKCSFNKKEYFNTLKFTLVCLFYFGIIPLPDRFYTFKGKGSQVSDYQYFENSLLRTTLPIKASNHQVFDATDVPQFFTVNQQKHLDFCFIRLAINGNEVLSTLGHWRDIGVSFPFFDRDLLSVAVQATDEQKFGNGYMRGTLRDALTDYLSIDVKNRTTKADFTTAALSYFKLLYVDFKVSFLPEHELWNIVDAQIFQEITDLILDENYSDSQKVKYTWLAMRVINFGIWLDQQKF